MALQAGSIAAFEARLLHFLLIEGVEDDALPWIHRGGFHHIAALNEADAHRVPEVEARGVRVRYAAPEKLVFENTSTCDSRGIPNASRTAGRYPNSGE